MQHRPVPRTVRVIKLLLRPILMVCTKRDWKGMHHLPSGGFVLAPNHLSHLDPFVISHFMLDNNISPQFLIKDSLFRSRWIGWILRSADQIPVYRSSGGAESLRAASVAMEAGNVVTVYPEGTITRDPGGWPMSGRTGAVRIALATGKPLVPVMQWGPQEILWPYAKRLHIFPRKTMHVRVAEPMDLSAYAGRPVTDELLHEATGQLMDTLTSMMSDVRGELPSTPRIDVHTLSRPGGNDRPAPTDKRLDS